jgi:hypothetical protein
MAFIQRIRPAGSCGAEYHGNCCVIDCVPTEPVTHHESGEVIHEAGAVVWHSHLDAAIHPEHRLNPDHPAEDHRSGEPGPVTVTPWCDDCKGHPAAARIFGGA